MHPKSVLRAGTMGLRLLGNYLRGRKEFAKLYSKANTHSKELTFGRFAQVKTPMANGSGGKI